MALPFNDNMTDGTVPLPGHFQKLSGYLLYQISVSKTHCQAVMSFENLPKILGQTLANLLQDITI